MGEIFLKLLNMSITASWLIVAVLGIRLLFRKIPKWVTCLLWGVVAIRLIFPFSIKSSSVRSLLLISSLIGLSHVTDKTKQSTVIYACARSKSVVSHGKKPQLVAVL